MPFLTKLEELFLLTITRLEEPAYLVNIRDHLLEFTGKDWAFGSLYMSLEKMRKKGLISTYTGTPEEFQGGKAKKYYQLTPAGITALTEAKRIQDVMWEGFGSLIAKKRTSDEKQ